MSWFSDIRIFRKRRKIRGGFHRLRVVLSLLLCDQSRDLSVPPFFWPRRVFLLTQSQLPSTACLCEDFRRPNPLRHTRQVARQKATTCQTAYSPWQNKGRTTLLPQTYSGIAAWKRSKSTPPTEGSKTSPQDLDLLIQTRNLCQNSEHMGFQGRSFWT